jgi:hypothetical protein
MLPQQRHSSSPQIEIQLRMAVKCQFEILDVTDKAELCSVPNYLTKGRIPEQYLSFKFLLK